MQHACYRFQTSFTHCAELLNFSMLPKAPAPSARDLYEDHRPKTVRKFHGNFQPHDSHKASKLYFFFIPFLKSFNYGGKRGELVKNVANTKRLPPKHAMLHSEARQLPQLKEVKGSGREKSARFSVPPKHLK